jgi:hypothetical protein
MKKKLFFTGMLALALTFGLILTGCGDKDDDDGGSGGGGGALSWGAVDTDLSYINAIAYGGDKFVAVGDNGEIATSSNGTEWTDVDTSSFFSGTPDINAIAYGGDKFVAVGETGIAYSSDGTTWTPVAGFSFTDINAIAYGGEGANAKFVAVGSDGIAYSSDGTAWTEATTTFSNVGAIAYGGGKFVAVLNQKTASSTDGITWTDNGEVGPYFYNRSIAYGGGKFVIGGLDLSSQPSSTYSSDGINWADVSSIPDAGPGSLSAIAYGGGRFVLIKTGMSTDTIFYSTNGTEWTESSIAFKEIKALAYGGGKFVAVGKDREAESGDSNKIIYSN